jgi:hypothetical protein
LVDRLEEVGMAQEKQPELGGHLAGNQVEEHVSPAAIARHANRELVGKVPRGFLFSLVVTVT